jgi:hypothetical protein
MRRPWTTRGCCAIKRKSICGGRELIPEFKGGVRIVPTCKKTWLSDWPLLGLVPGRAITEWKNINWEI